MHRHFADSYAVVDTGFGDRLVHVVSKTDGGGTVGPVASNHAKRVGRLDKPDVADANKAVTTTDKVKSAISDGAISAKEKTLFEKGKNDSIVTSERDRLNEVL